MNTNVLHKTNFSKTLLFPWDRRGRVFFLGAFGKLVRPTGWFFVTLNNPI